MASASGTGGTGGGTGGEKGGGKDKAPQKRDFRKGKPYKTYTLAEKEKIVEMIEDGYRTCEIVRVLRVPESSVRNIRRAKTDVKKNIASIKKYTCNLKNEKRQEGFCSGCGGTATSSAAAGLSGVLGCPRAELGGLRSPLLGVTVVFPTAILYSIILSYTHVMLYEGKWFNFSAVKVDFWSSKRRVWG